MATVIVGGGIIGTSIAYYLSDPKLSGKNDIHIVDTSLELFASASGYAAGFLAKDWYMPELASLGELSFSLHRQLAEENNGFERWGYIDTTAVSLQVSDTRGKKSARRDDTNVEEDPAPLWLTSKSGGPVDRISDEGSTAQVDPLRLSQFLLSKCIERGVRVHHPCSASSLRRNATGAVTQVVLERLDTGKKSDIPCANLVLAAGAWTQRAFATLFPTSRTSVPVSSLAGHSLVLQSPRHTLTHERENYGGKAHAVFATLPRPYSLSPEIFSRAGGEIYIAGVNAPELRPPPVATDTRQMMKPEKCAQLRKVAVALMGKVAEQDPEHAATELENEDDLMTAREGLCFRPYMRSGLPIISKVQKEDLGDGVVPPGVYMAVGHGPWGISLSLGTGKVIAERIAGVNLSADIGELGF